MARAVWLYYMCKITELLDTVFFVLRKKQNQITFLHLYHHTLMPICGLIGIKYFAGKWNTLWLLLLCHRSNPCFFVIRFSPAPWQIWFDRLAFWSPSLVCCYWNRSLFNIHLLSHIHKLILLYFSFLLLFIMPSKSQCQIRLHIG